MRSAVTFAVGALVMTLVSPPPAAAQAAAEWKPSVKLFVQKPAPKAPSIDWNRRTSLEQALAAAPSVVCGMTLIPADPKIDPKIRVPSQDGRVRYTIRSVEPTICKP